MQSHMQGEVSSYIRPPPAFQHCHAGKIALAGGRQQPTNYCHCQRLAATNG
jgi:hypothetical protein